MRCNELHCWNIVQIRSSHRGRNWYGSCLLRHSWEKVISCNPRSAFSPIGTQRESKQHWVEKLMRCRPPARTHARPPTKPLKTPQCNVSSSRARGDCAEVLKRKNSGSSLYGSLFPPHFQLYLTIPGYKVVISQFWVAVLRFFLHYGLQKNDCNFLFCLNFLAIAQFLQIWTFDFFLNFSCWKNCSVLITNRTILSADVDANRVIVIILTIV